MVSTFKPAAKVIPTLVYRAKAIRTLCWVYGPTGLTDSPTDLVVPTRLVKRGLPGKSWHIHFTPLIIALDVETAARTIEIPLFVSSFAIRFVTMKETIQS